VARPPLPVGTAGKIGFTELANGKIRARAFFRDFDGVARPVTRYGSSRASAERKLKDRVRYWERAKRAAGRQVERVEPSSADDESLLACYASLTTPSQEAIAREQMERIEAAFDELSERERDLIVQKCILGLSNEEIAAGIGESPHYTRTLLSRAQVRLSALVDRIRG